MLTLTQRKILAAMEDGCWWSADRIENAVPGVGHGEITLTLVELAGKQTRGFDIVMSKTQSKSGTPPRIIWRIVYKDLKNKPTFSGCSRTQM